jgi:serine/threonine-protein kinase
VRQLRLRPLDLVDVESLVSSMVTLRAEERHALAERLADTSGGVPSAIVDTIAAMVDQQQLMHDGNGGWTLGGAAAIRASPTDFVSRTLRGRYTTDRVVYKGEALTTYAAVEVGTGRRVELHVPNRRLAAAGEAERFLQVVERVAGLAHPGILPIAGYGATGGVLYFATPALEAESLRDRLVRGRPMAIEESVRIAADVARALAHAHAHGVHHHDLRPKHVLLTHTGVLVCRFGLSEALSAIPAAEGSAPDDTGVLIGAPAYLSPEQLADESAADARSDVYSLGCVLHEMLTGEPPFGGRGRGLIARKLTDAAPPVRSLRPDAPEALDCLVRKCLSRLPADRYASAAELLGDLLSAISDQLSDNPRTESAVSR